MAYERLDEALRQLKTDREHAEVTENQRKRGDEKARIRFARIKSAVIGPVFDEVVAHVYGVLHDPIYHETYAINLKREFPRTPFYEDFRRWRDWGQTLLDLHIGYETVDRFPLTRTDVLDKRARAAGQMPKVILKADRETGIIVLDAETQLAGVPGEAWNYRLGNRSALEWVLDQHKVRSPKHPIIREKFNTYRFTDYKERVINLLTRVTTVSLRTVEIIEAMRTAPH